MTLLLRINVVSAKRTGFVEKFNVSPNVRIHKESGSNPEIQILRRAIMSPNGTAFEGTTSVIGARVIRRDTVDATYHIF